MESVPGSRPEDLTRMAPRAERREGQRRGWKLEEAVALAVCLALALSAMFCVTMMGA